MSTFTNTSPIRKAKSGSFDKDYFSLRKKPHIQSLFIDDETAVAIFDPEDGKKILIDGLYHPTAQEEIAHVFDLKTNQFFWGAKTERNPYHENPTRRKSLVKANSIATILKRTESRTRDGRTIAPVFSIYYKLKPISANFINQKYLASISDHFTKLKVFGDLKSSIEETLGQFQMNQFKIIAAETDVALFNGSPEAPSSILLRSLQERLETSLDDLANLQDYEKAILASLEWRSFLFAVWLQ